MAACRRARRALAALCLLAQLAAAAPADNFAVNDLSHADDLQAVAGDLVEGPMQPSMPLPLTDAVALALRQNAGIRLAALQRVIERFAVYVAHDKFNPHYTTNASVGQRLSYGPSTVQDPNGFGIAITPHVEWLLPSGAMLSADVSANRWFSNSAPFAEPYSALLQVTARQPLLRDLGPEINRASVRQAVARDGVRKMAYASGLIGQLSAVILTYRQYSQASMQHSIAQKGVLRARQVLGNNQQMVSAGRLARADLVQVEADIASREANLAAAEAARTAASIALLQLLTLPPTTPIAPVPEAPMQPLRLTLEQVRSTALQYRPDYTATLLGEDVARQGWILARNARRWDLALTAQYQRGTAANAPLPALGGLGVGPSQAAFVGLTLTTPLFDVNQDEPVIVARAELAQARINRAATAIAVELQADGALRNLHLQQRVYRLAVAARRLSAKNLENEQEKLQAGRSSTFVVLRFVDALVNAEGNEIAAQVGLQNAVTAVQSQTGTLLQTYGVQPE